MRALEIITGHMVYNPAYTYKIQLKTTLAASSKRSYLNFPWLKCTLFSSFLPSSLTQGHFSSGAPEMLCTSHYYAADFPVCRRLPQY